MDESSQNVQRDFRPLPLNITLKFSLSLSVPWLLAYSIVTRYMLNERSIGVSTIRWLNRLNLSPAVRQLAMGSSVSRVHGSEIFFLYNGIMDHLRVFLSSFLRFEKKKKRKRFEADLES